MLKNFVILFIFCFAFTNSKSQNQKLDSLFAALRPNKLDTTYVKNLIEISDQYARSNKYSEAKTFCLKAIKNAELIEYKSGIIIAFIRYAYIHYNLANYDSSLFFLNKAQGLCNSITDKNKLGDVAHLSGAVYEYKGNYKVALAHTLRAVKIYEELNDKMRVSLCYNSIGNIYVNQKNYAKGLEYYLKTLKISEDLKDQKMLAYAYFNIGSVYFDNGNYEKALVHYSKVLDGKLIDKFTFAAALNNIGNIYTNQKKYSEAIFNFKKALDIQLEIGDKKGVVDCYTNLSVIYINQNKTNEAEKYLNKALALAIEIGDKKSCADIYSSLSNLFEKKVDYKKALTYKKLLLDFKDTLYNTESSKQMIEMSTKYETEKKNKEIILLNKDKEKLAAENKIEIAIKEKNFIITNAVIILFSISILFTYGYITLRKQKKNQVYFTQQLIQKQEDERKHIAKELHDGIGQNLLILKTMLKQEVPLIDATIEDLRNISRNMHPSQLEKLGFEKAVESIINDAKFNSTILFTYELDNVGELLTPTQQINLFRIIQECVSNIIKHAQTSAAKIAIIKVGNKIITSIYDKGKGFNLAEAKKKKSLGITSITERVELLNGKLNIVSNNNGTRINVIIKYA